MPWRPKHPCQYPGCPNLTYGKYCEKHERMYNSDYEKYERDPRTKKRYGRSWQRTRAAYAKAHPFCEQCLKEGRLTPVEQVHHKIPLSEGGTNDWDNLMSLCASCHARIHAKRGDRWHNHRDSSDGGGAV